MYAFTLHDVDRMRLLGFDNAHGLPRVQAYDHRHRSRRTAELVRYDDRGADELICDFFAAVEIACGEEGVPFAFEAEGIELEPEDDDAEEPGWASRGDARRRARGTPGCPLASSAVARGTLARGP